MYPVKEIKSFHPESSQSAGDKAWGTGRGSCGAEPGVFFDKKRKREKKASVLGCSMYPPSLAVQQAPCRSSCVPSCECLWHPLLPPRENPAKLGSFEHQDLGSALELGWLRKPAVSCWLLPWGTQGFRHASQSPDQRCSQRHPLLVSPAPPRTRLCLSSYTSSSLLEGAAGH